MKNPLTQGLTLIELLVAIALGLIVLLAASNLLISSSRSATDVQGRNELLEESQIAQNYMAGQLREAVYVFPVGTTIKLGVTGYSFRNPVSGNGTWRVGQAGAPIVAFIRPPQVLPPPPKLTVPKYPPCSDDPRICYQLIAYYPVLRSFWTEKSTSLNNPGDDQNNDGRWIVAEYRANYEIEASPTLTQLQTANYNKTGGSGRLLLDYVQPQSLALTGTPPLFQVTTAVPQVPGNTSVTINLALSRQVGSRTVTVPGRNASTTGPQSVTPLVVTPRNVGNLSP